MTWCDWCDAMGGSWIELHQTFWGMFCTRFKNTRRNFPTACPKTDGDETIASQPFTAVPRNNDTASFFLTWIPKRENQMGNTISIFSAHFPLSSTLNHSHYHYYIMTNPGNTNVTSTTRFVRISHRNPWNDVYFIQLSNLSSHRHNQPIWGVYNWLWWSTQQHNA